MVNRQQSEGDFVSLFGYEKDDAGKDIVYDYYLGICIRNYFSLCSNI